MKKKYIIISSLAVCIFLYFVEQVWSLDYITKSIIKIVLFTQIPYLYMKFIKKSRTSKLLNYKNVDKFHLKAGLVLGIFSFCIIFITYYFLKNMINLQSIIDELQQKSKITPTNFIGVGIYITLINSFLEEFFFRGFVFLNLYELKFKKSAYVYSSFLFGIYHIGIFKNWFNIWLILLALIGLITIGFIFNFIDTKSDNFINSWIVHILADSAIILIGMRMFNII